MTCPNCNGNGRYPALVRPRGGDCYQTIIDCHLCKGSGDVVDEMADWIERGEKLRTDRRSRRLGQREEAKRRGMSVFLYSQMEHGRIEPTIQVEGGDK